MAFSEELNNRIREILSETPNVEEKYMFGGSCFMVNDKMCVGVIKDELMCRINAEEQDNVLEKNGCRMMDFTAKPMKGYIMVDNDGIKNQNDLKYYISLALEFNKIAKSGKKKK